MIKTPDIVTAGLLKLWAEHRKAPIQPDADAPGWLQRAGAEWERMDSAYRLLIGVRLANDALAAWQRDHQSGGPSACSCAWTGPDDYDGPEDHAITAERCPVHGSGDPS